MSQQRVMKKARSSRTTNMQYTTMLDFFLLNIGLAEGRFNALHGREGSEQKWTELAAELNELEGAHKTPKQWQVVWRDLKSRISIKVRDLKKAKGLTGNRAINDKELSELDMRVIDLIGTEYVEGSSECVESIPERLNIQRELIQGNSKILMDISSTSNLQNCIFDDEDMTDVIAENNGNEMLATKNLNKSATANISLSPSPANLNLGNSSSISVPMSSAAEVPNTENLNTNRSSRRLNRAKSSIAAQLQPSTNKFETIAQKQADAMLILAEASKMQAEAAMQNALTTTEMAAAAKRLADTPAVQASNDRDRLSVMDKLISVLENIVPTYLQ